MPKIPRRRPRINNRLGMKILETQWSVAERSFQNFHGKINRFDNACDIIDVCQSGESSFCSC